MPHKNHTPEKKVRKPHNEDLKGYVVKFVLSTDPPLREPERSVDDGSIPAPVERKRYGRSTWKRKPRQKKETARWPPQCANPLTRYPPPPGETPRGPPAVPEESSKDPPPPEYYRGDRVWVLVEGMYRFGHVLQWFASEVEGQPMLTTYTYDVRYKDPRGTRRYVRRAKPAVLRRDQNPLGDHLDEAEDPMADDIMETFEKGGRGALGTLSLRKSGAGEGEGGRAGSGGGGAFRTPQRNRGGLEARMAPTSIRPATAPFPWKPPSPVKTLWGTMQSGPDYHTPEESGVARPSTVDPRLGRKPWGARDPPLVTPARVSPPSKPFRFGADRTASRPPWGVRTPPPARQVHVSPPSPSRPQWRHRDLQQEADWRWPYC